jgi:hypothetical protein
MNFYEFTMAVVAVSSMTGATIYAQNKFFS